MTAPLPVSHEGDAFRAGDACPTSDPVRRWATHQDAWAAARLGECGGGISFWRALDAATADSGQGRDAYGKQPEIN
jgi:hypothetical protein